MTTHEITTSHNTGMAFTATINGHSVRMDTADEGGNSGPSPKRLMLASLAGCTGIDIVSILDKMKVKYTDLQIDVKAGLTDEHPKIYKDVKISYRIRMAGEDQHKMKKAVDLSQDKYCGVSAMFKAFAKVDSEIVFL